MTKQEIIVFARRPELGKVKTRLAAGIGEAAALAVYRELLSGTRAAIAETGVSATVWLAGVEDARELPDYQPEWPDFSCRVQPAGDLGQRMATAFAAAFAAGCEAVVIIGTDCPELSAAHIIQAFDRLKSNDLVLGPAADGGYYLLGMRAKLRPELFANKAWSTDSVLADTLADAHRLEMRVAFLPELSDIDNEADLTAWRQRVYRQE